MRVQASSTLPRWIDTLDHVAERAKFELADVVEDNARQGLKAAQAFATKSSGRHGWKYPLSMSGEEIALLVWEYGPEANKDQGAMLFERGEGRQSKPHLDLARSADIAGPSLGRDVARLAAKWLT